MNLQNHIRKMPKILDTEMSTSSGSEMENESYVKEEMQHEICVKEESLDFCEKFLNDDNTKDESFIEDQKKENIMQTISSNPTSDGNKISNVWSDIVKSGKMEEGLEEHNINEIYFLETANELENLNDSESILLAESNSVLFRCSKCDYKTTKKFTLVRHSICHSDARKYQCTECRFETKHKGALKRHLLTHSELKSFNCTECHYKSNRKENLKSHMVIHVNEELFKCSECEYKTKRKDELKFHSRIHSDSFLRCFHCDYKTVRKNNMKRHLLVHSDSKLYKCSECHFETNRKHKLTSHMESHSSSEFPNNELAVNISL